MIHKYILYGKEILRMALPIAGSNISSFVIPIAMAIMLSRLGSSFFAAGALISTIQATLMIFFSSPLFSISSIVSRLFSEGKSSHIGGVIREGIILSVLLSTPVVLILLFISPILSVLGQPPYVVNIASQYFSAYIWSVPLIMIINALQQFLLGIKKSKMVSVISIVGLLVVLLSGYLMSFGIQGHPGIGVPGLGYSQIFRCVIIIPIIIFSIMYNIDDYSNYNIFERGSDFYRLSGLKKIFNLGWPISINSAGDLLFILMITIFMGWYGRYALIAQQVSSQFALLLSIVTLSIAQTLNVYVSQCIGMRDTIKANCYLNVSIFIGVAFVVSFLIVFLIDPYAMLSPYINTNTLRNEQLIISIIPYLIVVIINQVFECIQTIYVGALRGMYDTKGPMIISLSVLWLIAIPLAYVLSIVFSLDIVWIAIAQSVSMVLIIMMLHFRWRWKCYNLMNKEIPDRDIVVST